MEQKRQLRVSNRNLKLANKRLEVEVREKQKTIDFSQVGIGQEKTEQDEYETELINLKTCV